MKIKIFLFFMLFSCFCLYGQEIQLKSGVVATAGISDELNDVNISKWRLGEVHLIVLQQNGFNKVTEPGWNVSSYPNPVQKVLNLNFQTEKRDEFNIQVTDITGKKVLINTNRKVLPNEVIQLDLAYLIPAIYLVSVTPKDKLTQRVIKIQKS